MSTTVSSPEVGRSFSLQLGPVEIEDIVRYAGAAGDFNPMHFDHDLAVAAGFPDNFAQGMLTAGLVGVLVGSEFGPERVRGLGIRFKAPVWVGDSPTVAGEVVSVDDDLARIELTVAVGERQVALGWMTIDPTDEKENE
jgi:acyl dehydratase